LRPGARHSPSGEVDGLSATPLYDRRCTVARDDMLGHPRCGVERVGHGRTVVFGHRDGGVGGADLDLATPDVDVRSALEDDFPIVAQARHHREPGPCVDRAVGGGEAGAFRGQRPRVMCWPVHQLFITSVFLDIINLNRFFLMPQKLSY
jgi:hypothetical protein